MTTLTSTLGTKTAITISLDSLASATYVAATDIDLGADTPLNVVVEVTVVTTSTAVSGNTQVAVFVQTSMDGTNYSTGPTSGTTATDEPDLYLIGNLPTKTVSSTHRKSFSIFAALGFIPRYWRLVCKNDLGTALSTGCSASYQTVVGNT